MRISLWWVVVVAALWYLAPFLKAAREWGRAREADLHCRAMESRKRRRNALVNTWKVDQ